jgi:hypothetical protein
MSECFFLIFEDGKKLDHAARVDSPLVVEGDLDASHKSDPNGDSFLRYDASPLRVSLVCLDLDDLIVKVSVTDLETSYFSVLIN